MEPQSEQQFLKAYDASRYPRPSVTADMILFTLDDHNRLSMLLIKRGGHPYKDKWAIPGGFLIAGKESADQAAARELFEETGIKDVTLRQLATFSAPDRDPRTHVISVAYTALIPKGRLLFQAGDDAKEAELFRVSYKNRQLILASKDLSLTENDLAFDHADIIKTAIKRLRGRIDYEPDAFELLSNPEDFTIYELKCIFEAIRETELDTPNFRKMFFRNYLEKGFVTPNGHTKKTNQAKAATAYAVTTKGEQNHV